LAGVGRSTKTELIIFTKGWDLRKEIKRILEAWSIQTFNNVKPGLRII
jgi:hypothetical protein